MMRSQFPARFPVVALPGIAAILLLSGCATTTLPGGPHLRTANRRVAIATNEVLRIVDDLRPYALMSELAYMPQDTRTYTPEEFRALCWKSHAEWLRQQGWVLEKRFRLACGNGSPEFVEFDRWFRAGNPCEVVVAFRGTDGASDWWSNLRGLLPSRRDSDQYARLHAGDIESCAVGEGRSENVAITATGHSLGGGLAQHLLYASQLWNSTKVTRAYAFNSSPMTGWNQFGDNRKKMRLAFADSKKQAAEKWRTPESMIAKYRFGTLRVNERGEGLAFARFFFRAVRPEADFMSVLNFNFEDDGLVGDHGMAGLAARLRYYPDPVRAPFELKVDPGSPVPR